MNKGLRINKPSFTKRLESTLFDLLATILLSVGLYFVVLYGLFSPLFGYSNNLNTINEYNEKYELNIEYGKTYDVYEKVIQSFYFEDFKDEILAEYNTDGKEYTIEHIYNVTVLNLPITPSSSNHGTSYYQYVINSDGSYNVDVLGEKIGGTGEYYDRNMCDLFYETYEKLPVLLRNYNSEYNIAFKNNSNYRDISRVSASIVSVVVFYIVFPLIFKNGSTLFEHLYKIGFVEYEDGYRLKTYKVFLRPLIYFLLPILGIYFFTKYSIILLAVLPLFINVLIMMFSQEKRDISEKFLRIESCDLVTSDILNSSEDKPELAKEVTDQEFLDRLENIDNKEK